MRRLWLVVSAVAVAASAGCASIGRSVFDEPVVALKNVELRGLGVTGGTLDVVLSVYNPNKFKLDATRLTYRVMIDSTPLGNGALDSRFVVNSRDSSDVRIPLAFSYAGLGAAGRQLVNAGTVNYRVTGDVTVGTPIGNFTRPYDRTGQFSTLSGTSR